MGGWAAWDWGAWGGLLGLCLKLHKRMFGAATPRLLPELVGFIAPTKRIGPCWL